MSNLFRHEQKYVCSAAQMKHLSEALSSVLPKDEHRNGSYHVKSIYFDTQNNRFLQESLDGVSERSKYRLRRYDEDQENIKFECKSSFFNLKQKRFVCLTAKETETLLQGKDDGICSDCQLLKEFYYLEKTELLRPKIIIDYDRTAFVHKNFNVRITLDQKIISSREVNLFLKNEVSGRRILPENAGILEVKFNEILPNYIVQVLGLEDLEQTAFSKYVRGCLAYGEEY